MKNFKPEVLAPVGSKDSLVAAVRSGADAVYLGAKEFSARRNAENFSEEELLSAIEYCHIRGVKVYLTLNIMLLQSELLSALQLVKNAARMGIDAVIVQDLGIVSLIRKSIPDLPIHASTQMSVHTPSALEPLKKLGISRVVVSRELSFGAISEICTEASRLDMTVEVFVHGALCMSVSGQCLLSAVLGGRSGNRGLCAGPCRLPFSAKNGTGYDLSLKDLSLFGYIDNLQSVGVASLKIEGRMKRPEYVAAAVSACRSACDSGGVPEDLEKALKNVFSRSGFTDGYFTDTIGKEMFGIRTKEDVVSANNAFPTIHSLYRNERQSVAISAKAVIESNKPIKLTLFDGINRIEVEGEIPSLAKSKPADEQSIIASLSKLGGTPYYMNDIEIHIDNNLYISAAALNSLRRDGIEALNIARSKVHSYQIYDIKTETEDIPHKNKPSLIARFKNYEQIPDSLDGIDGIILPIECDLPEKLPENVYLIADIPRGILSEEYISKRLELLSDMGFVGAYCGNIAAIPLALKAGLKIIGGIGLNVANSQNISVLNQLGAEAITLSPELTLNDCTRLSSPLPKGIFAYGRLPLMLTRNCPIKNGMSCNECNRTQQLTDRKNIEFPIHCRLGFSEMLNSLPIWLADRLNETRGLDYLLLYFTDEAKEDISKIINMYKKGESPPAKYTRGLYYRNLI